MKTAILVDGGYYRKRTNLAYGSEEPAQSAQRLYKYCSRHLKESCYQAEVRHDLYRIFYYDCPPLTASLLNPFGTRVVDYSKSDTLRWTQEFFMELSHKRRIALRMGELSESSPRYTLREEALQALLSGQRTVDDLKEMDFRLNLQQKGTDIRIGLDICSLAYKQQVDRIILIAGDSDFVPAAKLARREGIDFILDPLGGPIKDNLSLHIDGLRTVDTAYLGH
ncbi:NYN domain-containing protein [Streptococcus danieliae]|uniref:NYN domain-containing protein n=1 Tax=Streptococcus danieliae TaxID=747656 RepID=A0A7X3G8W7_9STRE|nr:NYN domain-containing protein [Streptococcus danieliae]MVX59165.1 NYN domain-containing protein [Streptococcus danieliae]